MRVSVVRIGNSRGIRIPKAVLKQCEISDGLDLRIDGRNLVLVPVAKSLRSGWEAAARQMAAAGDDALLIPESLPDDEDIKW